MHKETCSSNKDFNFNDVFVLDFKTFYVKVIHSEKE